MKLEVGMYVRTKNGLIAKYIGYEKSEDDINFSKYNFDGKIYWYYEYYNDYVYEENFKEWFEKRVVKASYNIIDILEVGDYVNGIRVNKIEREDDGVFITIGTITNFVSKKEENPYLTGGVDGNNERLYQLKSIVTSQQFESISYKAGDSNE